MEKEYQFEVKIITDHYISAKSEKEARQMIKDGWLENDNIELQDSEITLIQVITEKNGKDGLIDVKIE